MQEKRIAFIGGGNMAASIAGGLVANGYNPDNIWVADPNAQSVSNFRARFGINGGPLNSDAVAFADVIVLAVKPQVLQGVIEEMAAELKEKNPLIISVAAGIRLEAISRWLGGELAIVRTMPNTPALVQSGATALYGNDQVDDEQKNIAESILRAVGVTIWLANEQQMDAVTAVSGSGPAYYFLVMEAMQAAGEQLGLTKEMAKMLTIETAFGAAKMALESSDESAELRRKVTSPGGTTEQAINVLMDGLPDLFAKALTAARDRSIELGDQLGGKA